MAFDALQVLQAAGLGEQRRMQERQMQARQQAGQLAAGGDFAQARQVAFNAGEFDFAGQLQGFDDRQRAQAAGEARAIYGVARRLSQIPMEQRAQAFQNFIPVLRQHGLSDDELSGVDLSDAGLQNYAAIGAGFMDNTQADEPSIIRTLRAVGIDPGSAEGRDIVTRSLSAPRYLPNGDGTFTVVGGGMGSAPAPASGGGGIPQEAIEELRRNPGAAAQFDEVFGAGAARNALGGPASAPGAFP